MDPDAKPESGPADELSALQRRIGELEAVAAARRKAEEDLRASEDRYRSLLANLPLGVFRSSADPGGRLLSANPALAKMFSYASPADMADLAVADLYARPADRRKFIEAVGAAGSFPAFEVELKRADGSTFWGSLSARAVKGADGAVAYFDGILEDVTERKRVEEALRQSEEFSRAAIENSPLGISVRNRFGQLLAANDAWKKIWAMSAEEFAADLQTERTELKFDEKDTYLGPWLSRLRAVYAEGGDLHIPELELPAPKAGTARWVSQYFYAIKDGLGQVDRVVILTEDVTVRKRMEEERDRHERVAATVTRDLQAIFDNVEVLLWSVREEADGELSYERVNEAFAQVEGKPPEYYNGHRIVEIATPQQHAAIRDRFTQVQQGTPVSYEVKFGDEADPQHIVVRLIPLADADGRVRRFIGAATDITEFKRAARELQRHVRTLGGLNSFARVVSQTANSADLLRDAAAFLADNPGVVGGGIYLHRGRALKLEASFGSQAAFYESRPVLSEEDDAVKVVLAGTGAVFVNEWSAAAGAGRVLACGMRTEGEMFGILTLILNDADAHTVVFVETIASELASGIRRKRAEEEVLNYRYRLEELVAERTDELTAANKRLQAEIGERKRAEDAIRYFSEFVEKIIENTQIGIYALDRQGMVQVWNEGMERRFGVDSERVVGHNVFEVFPNLAEEPLGAALRRALDAGEPSELTGIPHRTLWRGERILNTKINPIGDGAGGVTGVVAITEDVTEREIAEGELRASQERYRVAAETALAGIIIFDAYERLTFVNSAFARMLGYAKDELVGMTLPQFADADAVTRYQEEVMMRAEGSTSLYESVLRRKDGGGRNVLISASRLASPGGRYEGSLAVVTDITERKREQEELARSQERYRVVAETALAGITITDADENLVFVNQAFADMLGYARAELMGRNLEAFTDADEAERYHAETELRVKGVHSLYETRLHRRDGTPRRVVVSASPMHKLDGRYDGTLAVITDITELKHAEEALRESEERYRRLVEAIHGGLAAVDGNETILYLNQAYCDMLGYKREELIGRNLRTLIPEEEIPRLLETTVRKKERRESTKYETVMLRKDGQPRDVMVSSTPMLNEQGEYMFTIGVALDITDQKRTQQDLELKTRQLEAEHKRADALLRNILPARIIEEYENNAVTTPRTVADAAVVFVNFVGFSEIATRINPKALVTKLAVYFHTFDLIVRDYGLEKLKTMGDRYIYAGGLFAADNQLAACAEAALDIMKFVGTRDWRVRIGLHVGPCIAGLIKGWRMIYDIWGPTVNLAARLEAAGEPSRINCSEIAYHGLADRFEFESRGLVPLADVGPTPMYYLRRRKRQS